MVTDFGGLEKLFLAMGDKTRLRLMALMADGPVAVGYLADTLGESQPKVSRHLAYLRNAGVVTARRDGKWIYYAVNVPEDAIIRNVLDRVVSSLRSVLVQSEPESLRFYEGNQTIVRPIADDQTLPDLSEWMDIDDGLRDADSVEDARVSNNGELDVFLL